MPQVQLSTNRRIWDAVVSLDNGSEFTSPWLREQKLPGIMSKDLPNSLSYLIKRGVIEKKNTWDGTNLVIYGVKDNSIKPRQRTGAIQTKSTNGRGLYAFMKSRKAKTTPTQGSLSPALAEIKTLLRTLVEKVEAI